MQSLASLIKLKPQKLAKIERWQDAALQATTKLVDGWKQENKGSIFRSYKLDVRTANLALQDAMELDRPYSKYFFKVFSELRKKVI